jgi:PUB domain/Ubiquitin family
LTNTMEDTTTAAATADTPSSITVQLTITAQQGASRIPLTIRDNNCSGSSDADGPSTTASSSLPDDGGSGGGAVMSSTELRQRAAEATKIPLASIKLIYRGRLIVDSSSNDVIRDYKIEHGSVLHCMGKPVAVVNHNDEKEGEKPAAAAAANLPTVGVSAAAAAGNSSNNNRNSSGGDALTVALQNMRVQNSHPVYQTAITTLDKVLDNIIQYPMEDKYRKLKRNNPAFAKRLGNVGHAALLACGFTVGQDGSGNTDTGGGGEMMYVLNASADAWPALLETKRKVALAVAQAEGATNTPPMASMAAGAGMSGGLFPELMGGGGAAANAGFPGMMMPGVGDGGFPGVATPEMQQAAARMMSNPQQLQAMLQVCLSKCIRVRFVLFF